MTPERRAELQQRLDDAFESERRRELREKADRLGMTGGSGFVCARARRLLPGERLSTPLHPAPPPKPGDL